jgi:RNA polymerase sigma factor (TIGR02999 family)
MAGDDRLPAPGQSDVTGLLLSWRAGEDGALDVLIPLVYDELRRLAHRQVRALPPDEDIQTTALVHEAYLRLLGSSTVSWQDRAHFFALTATLMRRVLVDAVRTHHAVKRGGLAHHVPLGEGEAVLEERPRALVALDEALSELAALDPRKAKVVELRYFGGLTAGESAHVLGISQATVERDWRVARLWLARELKGTVA